MEFAAWLVFYHGDTKTQNFFVIYMMFHLTRKSAKWFSQRKQRDYFVIFYKRHKGIDHTNNMM